jgi:hypothetical protein
LRIAHLQLGMARVSFELTIGVNSKLGHAALSLRGVAWLQVGRAQFFPSGSAEPGPKGVYSRSSLR